MNLQAVYQHVSAFLESPLRSLLGIGASVGTSKAGEVIASGVVSEQEITALERIGGAVATVAGAAGAVFIAIWWGVKIASLFWVKFQRWKNHEPIVQERDISSDD